MRLPIGPHGEERYRPEQPGHTQQTHWEETYAKRPDFFGAEPSEFGLRAAATFARHGLQAILELACGQGRDTFMLLQRGFEVTALDYSEAGLRQLDQRAKVLGGGTLCRSPAVRS